MENDKEIAAEIMRQKAAKSRYKQEAEAKIADLENKLAEAQAQAAEQSNRFEELQKNLNDVFAQNKKFAEQLCILNQEITNIKQARTQDINKLQESIKAAEKKTTEGTTLINGGGLGRNSGGLYINSRDIVQQNCGLLIDKEGKIFLDFQHISSVCGEDKIKKSCGLLSKFAKNMTFYVDINKGTDTEEPERGLKEDKPFMTIQACVDHICDNYNLGPYSATILVAGGTYPHGLVLGKFESNGGFIYIKRRNKSQPVIVERANPGIDEKTSCAVYSAGDYDISNLTFYISPRRVGMYNAAYVTETGDTIFRGCSFVNDMLKVANSGSLHMRGIFVQGKATIAPEDDNTVFKSYAPASGREMYSDFYYKPFKVRGSLVITDVKNPNHADKILIYTNKMIMCAEVLDGGSIQIQNNCRAYRCEMAPGVEATGKSFRCHSGGGIEFHGIGKYYFPGYAPGEVDEKTNGWYTL